MNKKTTKEISPWGDDTVEAADEAIAATPTKLSKPKTPDPDPEPNDILGFDMEGLMTDFPTAVELERFVYDRTGIVLNLKGRSNKLKYSVALDCLNGIEPDPAYLGNENPYLDKSEIVPVDTVVEILTENGVLCIPPFK